MGMFADVIARESATLFVRKREVVVRGDLHMNGIWFITAETYVDDVDHELDYGVIANNGWVELVSTRVVAEEETFEDIVDGMIPEIRDALIEQGLAR